MGRIMASFDACQLHAGPACSVLTLMPIDYKGFMYVLVLAAQHGLRLTCVVTAAPCACRYKVSMCKRTGKQVVFAAHMQMPCSYLRDCARMHATLWVLHRQSVSKAFGSQGVKLTAVTLLTGSCCAGAVLADPHNWRLCPYAHEGELNMAVLQGSFMHR
jgi:hypothetical protein